MQVYTADTTNRLTYQWFFNGFAISGATDRTYQATAPGYYQARITNSAGSRMLGGCTVVAPPAPVIGMTSAHILFTGSFVTYQWMKDSILIPGANASVFTSTGVGNYNVIVTDGNGCSDTSAPFRDSVTTLGTGQQGFTGISVSVYPNPANSTVHVEAPIPVNAVITTADGKVVIRADRATIIDVSDLAPGLYLISVYDQTNTLLKIDRFVKVE
jgi:hypothetical protein